MPKNMQKTKMKFTLTVLIAFVAYLCDGQNKSQSAEEMVKHISWLGQATVKLELDDQRIYIDPVYHLKEKEKADIILITHPHQDHYSPEALKKIIQKGTVILAPPEVCSSIEENLKLLTIATQPGFQITIGELDIKAVPAYNVVKTKFHPKEKKWLGYVLTWNGVSIYHTGDTERIPEMQTFTSDIVLLPLGQTYTMNSVKEAAEVVRDVEAKIAIPIHYGMYEGTIQDAQEFADLLKNDIKVILQKAPE
jgi:L-ascorbate metabolism protein UlaG (beta-lactamase superfamily)